MSQQGLVVQKRDMANRELLTHSETLTWLHLSDFHFRATEHHTWNENIVLRALLEDVQVCIAKEELTLDLILVSGDIAFSGAAAEYALARDFFDQLRDVTNLPKERLFVVPGNHDVDRNLISRGAQAIGDSLTDRDSANAILASSADRRLIFARFESYAVFVNDYFGGHLSFDEEYLSYVHTLDLAGQRTAIIGLNSAWLCASDEDRARGLLIGERQVRAALDAARETRATLKIALLHHPFDWLREFDRSDSEGMLIQECAFILHGHMHKIGLLQARTPDANAMIISAGASYKTREFPNSYNLVQLDTHTGKGKIYLRMYSDQQGGFWTNDVTNYRNVPNGVYEFQLSRHDSYGDTKFQSAKPKRSGRVVLAPVPQSAWKDPRAPGHEQRCADLSDSICEILELIRQYENQHRLTDDPKARQRAKREIADLRQQLARHEAEYQTLGCKDG